MKSCFQKYGAWLLFISLVINAFLLSFLMSSHAIMPRHPMHETYGPLHGAIKSLSPEGQEVFKKSFLKNSDLILETKNLSVERRLEMIDKIAQENLDLDAINALMTEVNDLTLLSQQGLQILLSQALEELSYEDRVLLSENLKKHKDKFKK